MKEANARNNQNIVVSYCLLVIATDYLSQAQCLRAGMNAK